MYYRNLQEKQLQSEPQRSTRFKIKPLATPTKVSLCYNSGLPDSFVLIENIWEPEKVVDRRLNAEGKYEYLMKYKKYGNVCTQWLSV